MQLEVGFCFYFIINTLSCFVQKHIYVWRTMEIYDEFQKHHGIRAQEFMEFATTNIRV